MRTRLVQLLLAASMLVSLFPTPSGGVTADVCGQHFDSSHPTPNTRVYLPVDPSMPPTPRLPVNIDPNQVCDTGIPGVPVQPPVQGGGYGGCPTCTPPPAPRVPGPFPDPAPDMLTHLESIVPNATTYPVDSGHEYNGMPRILKSVYTPSSAQLHTSPTDFLNLADGLPNGGLALLLEPRHLEAQLVMADTALQLNAAAHPLGLLNGSQALDYVELLQGVPARNTLARILSPDITVHPVLIAPEAPTNLTLSWSSSLPADGSWLLVHTDPTRLLQATLAGLAAPLSTRAPSHYSPGTDWRWDFLNLHLSPSFEAASFCYDPSTNQSASLCQGYQWPGWIRAFSGQAAFALESIHASLEANQVQLTTTPPDAVTGVQGRLTRWQQDFQCIQSNLTSCLPVSSCSGIGVPGACAAVCPTGQFGITFNGQGICILPPTQEPCPPGMIGFQINDQGYCFTIPGIEACPTGSFGIVLGGTPVCAPLPTAGQCPPGQLGVVINGTPVCVTTNPCGPSAAQATPLERAEHLAGNQSQLVRDLELARGIQAAGSSLQDAVQVAKLTSTWQATALNDTLVPTPAPQHTHPSQAARLLLAEYNVTPTPTQNQSLAALDNWTHAPDLTRLLDAFLAYQHATQVAYQNANWTAIMHAVQQDLAGALGPNSTAQAQQPPPADLRGMGVNLARIFPARNQMLDAYVGLVNHGGPTPAGPALSNLDLCPALALDLVGTDSTYNTTCAFILDVGGNDTYNNNAGGSNTPLLQTDYCFAYYGAQWREGTAAAALFDQAGNDRYGAPPYDSCGINGGGALGAGLLLDQAGNDVYNGYHLGINGAGYYGAGFLMDLAGSDRYQPEFGNIGRTYYPGQYAINGGSDMGAGFLYDGSGSDVYEGFWNGINGGATAGVGFLLDRGTADDTYLGPRQDWVWQWGVNSNGANGGAMAGAGFLMDEGGNDAYRSSMYGVNGGGYEGGTGFLLDEDGNDSYFGEKLGVNGGASLAGSGLLLDLAGNDSYTVAGNDYAPSSGTVGANGEGVQGRGLLLDMAGTDTYQDQSGGTGTDKTVIPKGTGAQVDMNGASPCTQSAPASFPQVPAPVGYHAKFPLTLEEASWQASNQSYALPIGVGLDYALDPVGSIEGASHIVQVNDTTLLGAYAPSTALRHFKFQGSYYSTPSEPRNLNHLVLGISSADGNETQQSFLVDGRRLAQLLDLRAGEQLQLTIDPTHSEGFQYTVRDLNGDGVPDVVLRIPHFSDTWITFSNQATNIIFYDVAMTGDSTAWLAGGHGSVYHFKSGTLTEYPIPGANSDYGSTTVDIHAFSDTDFWVVGLDQCTGATDTTATAYPILSHYQNGQWTRANMAANLACVRLTSIQMTSTTTGWAAGYDGKSGQGALVKYSNGLWTLQGGSPTICGFTSMNLDSNGNGYLGVGWHNGDTGACDNDTGAKLFAYSGGTPTGQSGSMAGVYGIQAPSTTYVTGFATTPTGNTCQQMSSGIFQHTGSSWSQVGPPGWYRGIDDGANGLWFGGSSYCTNGGSILHQQSGAFVDVALPANTPAVYDLQFRSTTKGLAVGEYGTILQFLRRFPPTIQGTVLPLTAAMDQAFSADGTGSSSNGGGTLNHQWGWGDGTHSYTATASHLYMAPGVYTWTHRVWSDGGDASQSGTVTVNPLPATVGVNAYHWMSHDVPSLYWELPAVSSDRYLAITWYGGAGPVLMSPLVDRLNPWPYLGASFYGGQIITGKLEANHALEIVLDWPVEMHEFDNAQGNVEFIINLLQPPLQAQVTFSGGNSLVQGIVATIPTNNPGSGQLTIAWGDGATEQWPASGLALPGTTFSSGHTYTTGGSKTVTVTNRDSLGQATNLQQAVTVYGLPTGVIGTPAPGSPATTSEILTGTLSSLGGAPSVTARYRVYNGATVVATGTTVKTAPGALTWTVTGLVPSTSYRYTITFESPAGDVETPSAGFQTLHSTVAPTIAGHTTTVGLGTQSTVTLTAASSQPSVAYWVRWDTNGTELRYPATGWVAYNVPVVATNTYSLIGVHPVEARLELQSGGRSDAAKTTETVTGAAPVSSFTAKPQFSTVDLKAHVTTVGAGVSVEFWLRDPSTLAWTMHCTVATVSNVDKSCTTQSLVASKTYTARIKLTTASGEVWAQPATSWLNIQTNRLPTLQEGSVPVRVSYLDDIRFAVTYKDTEADPPGTPPTVTPPTLQIAGHTYTMLPGASTDYRSGVEYHYTVPNADLMPGVSAIPTYTVVDQFNRQVQLKGVGAYVSRDALATLTFEADPPGGSATGTTKTLEAANYWHVTNTEAAEKPDRVALSHHGHALWFGREDLGTYHDPDGGTPAGSVSMPVMNLARMISPSLTFSSYYETEDLGITNDAKVVEICTTFSSGICSAWNSAPIYRVSGIEGGFGSWRTQHVDLSQYASQVVQLRFTFRANDNVGNDHIGWLIDDVSVGQDHDADFLSDALERANIQQIDSKIVKATVPAKPGVPAEQVIQGLQTNGAEQVIISAVATAPSRNQVRLTVDAVPHYSTDDLGANPGLSQRLVDMTGTGSGSGVCSVAPVQKSSSYYQRLGMGLAGSPLGFPNPAPTGQAYDPGFLPVTVFQSPAQDLDVEIDVASCIKNAGIASLGLGSQPLDFVVRAFTMDGSQLSLQSVSGRVFGRTSMMNRDSYANGRSDDVNLPRTSVDGFPYVMPAVDIDLHDQGRFITFRLSAQVTDWSASFVTDAGTPVSSQPLGMDGRWLSWKVPTPGNGVGLRATWLNPLGDQLSILLTRTTIVTKVGVNFDSAKFGLIKDWETQTLKSGIADYVILAYNWYSALSSVPDYYMALAHGPWALPYVAKVYLLDQIQDAIVEKVLNAVVLQLAPNDYEVTPINTETTPILKQGWLRPQGGLQWSIAFPGATNSAVYSAGQLSSITAALEAQSVRQSYLTHGDGWRLIVPDGSNAIWLLDVDYHGDVKAHKRIAYTNLPSMMGRDYRAFDDTGTNPSPVEAMSLERLLADVVYRNPGSMALPCHQTCFLPGTGDDVVAVDDGFVTRFDPSAGQNNVRAIASAGLVPAIRDNWYRGVCCDRFIGQNTLGLQSLTYTYRLANQSSFGRPPQFNAYWGERIEGGGNENCLLDKSQRRCKDFELGQSEGRFGGNTEPFRFNWTRRDTGAKSAEDLVVGTYYWYGSDPPLTSGQARVENAQAKALQAIGNSLNRPKIVAAFDLAGPVGISDNPTSAAWKDRQGMDGVFSQTYP